MFVFSMELIENRILTPADDTVTNDNNKFQFIITLTEVCFIN